MNSQRDLQLDLYRGWAMIYIVCIIHVLYCFKLPLDWKPYLLVEMPVIFFIAGASFRLAPHKKGWELVKNRFKRVYRPYYRYLVLSLLFSGGYAFFVGPIQRWSELDVVKALLAFQVKGVPYAYHVWFILPYFLISISANQQIVWQKRLGMWLFLACNLLLALGGDLLEYLYPVLRGSDFYEALKNTIVYNLFYWVGYFFYQRVSKKVLVRLLFFFFAAYWCTRFLYPLNMQVNKFPPNLSFLLYNAFSLSLLSLLFSYISMKPFRFVKLWNDEGYNIYLYQNFFFIVGELLLVHCLRIDFQSSPYLSLVLGIPLLFALGSMFGMGCRFISEPRSR